MDEDGDSDNDGLPDNEEIRIHGTYPTLEDSDGDLWNDSYELTNSVFSTNPLNPDSDGDTLIDSVDANPLVWEDVSAISTNDGYSTQYHTDNGYDPGYDFSIDSDNDGSPDWIEQLCGTSETNAGSRCYQDYDYFDVTITLAADLSTPVILKIGPRTLCLQYAGTRSVKLSAGVAHAVTLLASQRCLVSLGITLSTGKAVLLNPSAVFSGGGVLPPGAEQAGGTVALARVNIDPGLICFHSSGSKAATGTPVPDMDGSYTWSWFETAGESITITGKTVNISWKGEGTGRSLNLVFRPEGATEDIYGYKYVYKCTLTEDDPGGDADEWIDPDSPPYPPSYWPQSPEETEESPSTNNAAGPGEPFYSARYGIAIAVNNDDDDADGKLDNESTEDGVTGDDDLYASYLYTPFVGGCCPCPAHNPDVSSVSIEYLSPNLRLWNDAEKTEAATGVTAGQMQYLEGVTPSTSVTGEPLILSWTEDDEYKAKTNNYTVFSLRMFGDYNLDGTINSNDYASASDISDNGWVMPVASNTLRRLELKNDVLIPGKLILSLSGDSCIRVWDTPNPSTNDTPLLVSGQTVTNDVDETGFWAYPDGMLYVEATDAGTATLCNSYQGTGDAEDFSCVTMLSITAVKVDRIEVLCNKFASSGTFGSNPVLFEGMKMDFGNPTEPPPMWWEPGTHTNPASTVFKVFYKYIKDANDEPDDFDIQLKAYLTPDIPANLYNISWWRTSDSPQSGSFDITDALEVKYQNPQEGGLYKFRLTLDFGEWAILRSEAWVMLPKAGGEVKNWLASEVDPLITRAEAWKEAVETVAISNGLDEVLFLSTAWITIASCDFDYQGIVGNPTRRYSFTDADRPVGHVKDDNISGMRGDKGNGDWDEPSFATLCGIPVSRAKINNAMYAVWGRELGYSRTSLKTGAMGNAIGRELWDSSTSQNAVDFGCDIYDESTQGTNVAAIITKNRAKLLQTPDTAAGLNDVNLWPDSLPVSGFWLPVMPTDLQSLTNGPDDDLRGRLFGED